MCYGRFPLRNFRGSILRGLDMVLDWAYVTSLFQVQGLDGQLVNRTTKGVHFAFVSSRNIELPSEAQIGISDVGFQGPY